jgi:hypothetical protein
MMQYTTLRSLIPAAALFAVSIVAIPLAHADDPAPATTTPSPETLKMARDNGLKPEVRKGVTVYCWEDADVGTRFKTKKCVDEARLPDVIAQRQAQRDQLTRGGGNYGTAK